MPLMRTAGWTQADPVDFESSWKIVTSTLLRRSYDAAPVSPLFLFERQQDFAYQQEVDGNPGKRHHIRFWKCPDGWKLPGGIAVGLACCRFLRPGRGTLLLHAAGHPPDQRRRRRRTRPRGAIQCWAPPRPQSVSVIRDFSSGYHSRNGGGDSIRTDGNLPVIDLTRLRPTPVAAGAHARHRLRHPAPVVLGAVLVLFRVLAALAVAGLLFTGSAERTWVADLAGKRPGAVRSSRGVRSGRDRPAGLLRVSKAPWRCWS